MARISKNVKICGRRFGNAHAVFKLFHAHFLFIFQAITRINYEEQISVLTEQVISLSEQLANSR